MGINDIFPIFPTFSPHMDKIKSGNITSQVNALGKSN